MYVNIKKRYPGNRYEYLITVAYKIKESVRENQDRKLDLFTLFKKGNQIIAEKQSNPSLVGPLFSSINMPSQWFWSKKSVRILENNTHMSIDHLTNIISYIAPLPFNAYMHGIFDTTDSKNSPTQNKTYRICTLGDCRLYRESSNDDNEKIEINTNPYASYYLFKLPPGKRLEFTAETEFSIPYVYKNEYDIDAQMEIKEIILFDVIDHTQLKCNPEQKFIYTDLDIDKKSVTNTFVKSSSTCAKFRRNHILPVLPTYEQMPHIYKCMNISRNDYITYHERIKQEDENRLVDPNTHISVTFSIIGSSTYTIKFLNDALTNLRRNIAQFDFKDKQFVSDVTNELIQKLESFKH